VYVYVYVCEYIVYPYICAHRWMYVCMFMFMFMCVCAYEYMSMIIKSIVF